MNNTALAKIETSSIQVRTITPQEADAWCALGRNHWESGNVDAAAECCRRTLALQPDHFEAHVGLGNALFSQGNHIEAAEQYQKALRVNPAHAVVHCNLGNILCILGKDDDAAACYQHAIQYDSNLFIAFYNLGNLRMRQGRYDKAANNYRRAVTLAPDDEQLGVIRQQGMLLLQNNRLDEARLLFTQLCQTYPEDVQSWLQLSTLHGKLGEIDAAGNCSRRALAIQPDNDQAHVVLGNVFFHHRKLDEALFHYEKALELNPLNVTALNNLGSASQTEDQVNTYLKFYREAIRLIADPTAARVAFVKIIKNNLPAEYVSWLDEELQECFSADSFDDKFLSRATSQLLRLKYNIEPSAARNGEAWRTLAEKIGDDKLFMLFLEKTVNADATFERFLIALRRDLLITYAAGDGLTDGELRVIRAIAQQGFNNEYVFALDCGEERLVNALRQDIEHDVPATPDLDLEAMLAVFGMYESPASLACREQLARMPQDAWSTEFRPFLEQTLLNPLEEQAIKGNIETIGRIEDATSRLVQSQYEENPYPRWLSVPRDRKRSLKLIVKQLFPDFIPPPFLDGPVRMLIAGCGTGKHPIQTASYDNIEITAVDISKSSLAYAVRMARKYGVNNVKFMQGDILQLGRIKERFHIIESVGVLHHMEDPLAGWRVLSELLVEGGLMSIGLYSELARKPIVTAREVIRDERLMPDSAGIRDFRRRILQGELGDELHGLSKVNDFYSSSECRDLLFHSTEHRFSLPQIDAALDELNLDFLGFAFDNVKTPNTYRAHFPEDKEMKSLPLWAQFEKLYPNTFIGMYKFWCQKN